MPARHSQRRSKADRHKLNLLALEVVATGVDLPQPARMAAGRTWKAAAEKAGVSRQHLHRVAVAMRREVLGH